MQRPVNGRTALKRSSSESPLQKQFYHYNGTREDKPRSLSVGLGDTLEFVLLLDGVAVGGPLGGVDELVTEALSNALDVTESSFTSSGAKEPDSLVDSPKGRYINSLSPDGTGTSNTGGVLTRSGVDDGVDHDLEGVLSGQQVDDLEAVLDDPDSHELLAVVPAVHHEGVHQTLNNGALSLAETLGSISSGGVGEVLGVLLLDGDVVLEGHVRDLNVLAAPLAEQLDLWELGHHVDWGLQLDWGVLGFLGPIVSHCGFSSSLVEVNQAILAW